MKIARLLLTGSLALGVLGCGQKGPLVMPDAQKHKRTLPALPAAPKPAARGNTTDAAPGGADSTPATTPATTPAPTPATPPSTPP
jgi:predicted small lipoprotein YifL